MTRRREAELAALFETASELAGMRDPEAVLHSIVRRARSLLNADVAYLTMNDPDGTYMRMTDGSISSLFQRVRLGLGEGLGGLVAQTAQPYATSDYFADARFKHTNPIDSSVREEGLVAILGVPLKLGERVIGVLYAADRTTREFPPEEVALLSSLADHAAIAIDTASLFETIRSHNLAMRRAEEAHDRLTDLVLRGGDASSVAAAAAELLGGGIAVHDEEGVELARVGMPEGAPPNAAVLRSRTTGRAVPYDGSWVCAVLAGRELLGTLTLARPDLDDADRRLFERASVVTALLLLLRRTVAEAENKVRGELITDILHARDPLGLIARARRIGVELTDEHVVLVTDGSLAAATHFASAHRGLAGVWGTDVVLVVPGTSATAVVDTAAAALGATVGGAGPVLGPGAVATAFDEARRCLRALLVLGREKSGAVMTDLGFVGVLLGDRADVTGYVRSVLGPLLDYDVRRGTELVHTLQVYFASGTNLTRAKDSLHVHVNTVVQRLDRVASLLGEDWQSPERLLEVQLALRLLRVLG
ncbi:GAF domain-containing protein [Lentzea tibetensis]|uniref:GAF domain-containing protein n=1 Tax=Lentzea tibetensis TaxID=2591470 RepID=A0A563EMJ9_9PSEU|nr:GAF domain-containing protein [Lentzea tibetensis]TWP48168.1 GAF domain-containing protein [Lentzea tibetensis]